MGSGINSTLILHPEGLDDITFDLTGTASRTAGYVVNLDTLRLNEEKRLEVAYSEGTNIDGGVAISSHGPLVPITFDVIVYGTSRADMIGKAEALGNAVMNALGGTLEFKPDDLGAGVRSTFYHYAQSSPPQPRERWDKTEHSSGLYRMQLAIELQTQPFATSDPDSPVSVLTATTVYNQDDAVAGHITISAADVKGTISALTQLRIRNLIAGAWTAIEKLWYARRTEGTLANFAPILEGGTPDTNSSIHWSTESDNTRRSNDFQRYAPPAAANDQWASLNYTVSNITDHEGKAAIAVICRSLAEGREDWDLKAALQVADVVVETGIKNVATTGMWTVLILGELDIPPTPISADESYAIKVYLYLRRNSGDKASAIDVDFVQLLYVDEYPQQVNITDGFTNAYKLLLENFKRELCHVVDQSTLAFEKAATALCPLLQLRPGVDNRIDFIWERLGGICEILSDGFGTYEAWRWLALEDLDDHTEWSVQAGATKEDDTVNYVEGTGGIKLSVTDSTKYMYYDWDPPLDFTVEGRFGDSDYVYLPAYVYDHTKVTKIRLQFVTKFADPGLGAFYYKDFTGLATGWNYLKVKKADFSESADPYDPPEDWSIIRRVLLELASTAGQTAIVTFDDLRLVRADPDDATKGNDTGTVWDFMRDVWHIEEQAGDDKTLGCLDNTAALEQAALIHEDPPTNIKYLAKVRAKRDNGEVGLIFRCVDGTSGSEDMAAFFIDTANDQLELRKWAAGAASDIAAAVNQVTAPDTDYWLGVWILNDSTVRCYFGTSQAAVWDDENKDFVASARKFNVTNAVFASGGALASGKCGVFSMSTLGRFDDVKLYGIGDGHVPGDTIQVEAKAIYRTIYPFRE